MSVRRRRNNRRSWRRKSRGWRRMVKNKGKQDNEGADKSEAQE